jgi:hypothetical protein
MDAEEPEEEEESDTPNALADASVGATDDLGWMMTGDRMNEEGKAQEASAKRRFSPEFWVRDQEDKVIRFRDNQPICGIYQYSYHDGNRWRKVTQPSSGEDLFAQSGKRPYYVYLYEIIDRTGYEKTDKKSNKRVQVTNVPSFWVVSEKVHRQLQHICKKRGDLTSTDFEVHREGSDKPVYTLMADDTLGSVPARVLKEKRLSDSVGEFYGPPTAVEQRRMLRMDEESPANTRT